MARAILYLFVLVCWPVQAVTVHRLISDGAVLQRGHTIPVSGSAQSTSVVVWLNSTLVGKTTVKDNQWQVSLPAQAAGGPHTLKIMGDEELIISDIYFGDVFLASGQSNMELTMSRVEEAYPEDVENADFPRIREFTVPDTYRFDVENTDYSGGKWSTATPENIRKLSALGFYFARELHLSENVPIGIINAALGGSPIEAWMAREILIAYPEAMAAGDYFAKPGNIEATKNKEKAAIDAWYQALNENDKGLNPDPWYRPDFNDDGWQTIEMPANLPGFEEGFAGVWWLRKHVHLNSAPDTSFILRLGRIVDADEVWVNGVKIGNTTYQYPPRRYTVPASALSKGDNVITVRVTSNGGSSGFVTDKPYFLGKSESEGISLSGSWKYKVSHQTQKTPSTTFIRWKPMGLFNAMIAPATHYPLSGVLWYQGESNASSPNGYADKLAKMMSHWRSRWRQPELAFFIVQLTNFMERRTQPEESTWAELRQEQAKAASTDNTALVVTIDIGEWNDIHPVNKREAAHRAALAAQHLIYNKPVRYRGPKVVSVKQLDDGVLLTFDTKLDPSPSAYTLAHSFAVAGEDGQFIWAKATIKDKQVYLNHSTLIEPKKVRYAWANNPEVSIFSPEGLPAAPFEIPMTL